MRLFPHIALGLIGRVFAILLVAVLIETAASTFLYERAEQVSVRDDEANRLAEHLVIARKLIAEETPAERSAEASELTTDRYVVEWHLTLPAPPPVAPSLDGLTHQVLEWEPSLAGSDLRLTLESPGRHGIISGALRLPDSSWITFRTRQPVGTFGLTLSRLMLALVPAVALILIGGLLVRQTLRPMRTLAQAANRIGHGQVSPIAEEGPLEVRHVIHAFNAMQGRIHGLIADRTQALAAVGHDFRTPLARLRLRADAVEDGDLRESIQRDVIEMDQMVTSLLSYLGGEDADEEEARIATDVAVMCATVIDDLADHGHQAEYHGPDHLDLKIRPVALKRALTNLTDNALHYGDRVDLRIETSADTVTIAVEDDGPGIPPEARVKALEPFVRLDPARGRNTEGFGLGLAIVRRAVAAHGGKFTLGSSPSGGLSARIEIPIA